MKSLTPFLAITVALLSLVMNLRSQGTLPKPPLEQVKALKAKNIEMIEKQKQTLLKLEEMEKQADQIRLLGKRS
jgi:hypothetical protein